MLRHFAATANYNCTVRLFEDREQLVHDELEERNRTCDDRDNDERETAEIEIVSPVDVMDEGHGDLSRNRVLGDPLDGSMHLFAPNTNGVFHAGNKSLIAKAAVLRAQPRAPIRTMRNRRLSAPP